MTNREPSNTVSPTPRRTGSIIRDYPWRLVMTFFGGASLAYLVGIIALILIELAFLGAAVAVVLYVLQWFGVL